MHMNRTLATATAVRLHKLVKKKELEGGSEEQDKTQGMAQRRPTYSTVWSMKEVSPNNRTSNKRACLGPGSAFAFRSFTLFTRIPSAFAPLGNKRKEGIALLACTYRPGTLTMLDVASIKLYSSSARD